MTSTQAPSGPIPVPEDFPVEWDHPDDARMFWEREQMHMPGQATALDADLMTRWIDGGFNPGCAFYDMPIRARYTTFHGWVYQAIHPVSHDEEEMERIGRSFQEKLQAALPNIARDWDEMRLPKVKRLIERMAAWSPQMTDAELAAHLDDAVAASVEAWEQHFQTVFPAMFAASLFDELYQDTIGGGALDSAALLIGEDNLSLEADREMYLLSRRALAAPAVREVLERTASADVPAALAKSEEGRAFQADLDAYLERYGKRADLFMHVSHPSLLEDPAPVISALRDAITRPDRDPAADLAARRAEADRLADRAREALAGYPQEVRDQFEFLLQAGRAGNRIGEDHNFWIDCRVVYEMRRIVLEAARRLVAAGAIDTAGDVVHLHVDEIVAGLRGDTAGLRDAAAGRRADMEAFAGRPWPPVLGTFPPGPPPDNVLTRGIFKFFGGPPQESAPGELRGNGGSSGSVRAVARVILSLEDADRLGAGEVLVTETTAPPWTPLFARAGAIVTDRGGVLSHCAVVAREYAIPAVVGTHRATATIRDGQTVDVDGDAGVVRIVE
jgi:rifampicin phosphotransferase